MIRVLFIGMTSNPGGIETYMVNIFSKLEGHGFHFEFINMQNIPLAYSNFIRQNGGIIRHVYIRGSHFEHLTRKYKAESFFSKYHDYDIVHLNTTYLNQIYWIKAAKKYGIKHLIIQSHNCGMDYKSLLFKILNNILAYYNKKYLLYNPEVRKLAASYDCGKWMFGKYSDFKIITNGINTNSYIFDNMKRKDIRIKLKIPPKYKILISTSRIEKQKNYPKIINVFNIVHKYNRFTKLFIVGSGSQLQFIKNIVNHDNLKKDVYFFGEENKESIIKLLSASDLMIMPSLYEAIPFSLTEAQSVGLPAVVSDVIPKASNITNKIKYVSLKRSDLYWAKVVLDTLIELPYNTKMRILMNNEVSKSHYSLFYSINKIKQYYLSIINK